MPTRRKWVFDPDAGGKKISEIVKRDIEKRIHAVANEKLQGKYTRLEIRFRGQFCYIDAYTEPNVTENWPPPNWPETREEYIERMRKTPVHLCRLRYFGNDQFRLCILHLQQREVRVFHVSRWNVSWKAGGRVPCLGRSLFKRVKSTISRKKHTQTPEYQWDQALLDAYNDYSWRQVLDPLYQKFQQWKAGEMDHTEVYEQLIAEREARFQVLDRIRSKLPEISEDEVEKDVSQVIDILGKQGPQSA
jgi:predicted CopG family antitoxin